ncbi:hypothetical protein BFC17_16750 [Alteromonas lipolytica]|uniref:Uncharacterized protein n=1 Tax=Alteromonas lipolytica TaxID=1856405 RepID=A0A1E8FGZ8_9ALTE|nr:hypothetical protein BFC17_16750 [Alteromonas lipolytica]
MKIYSFGLPLLRQLLFKSSHLDTGFLWSAFYVKQTFIFFPMKTQDMVFQRKRCHHEVLVKNCSFWETT